MVTLKVRGSGSTGNMYSLTSSSGQTLVLDAGFSFLEMKKALNFQISKVSVLATHAHGDHVKGVKACIKAGIPVYASVATHEKLGTIHERRAKLVEADTPVYIGEFIVVPFELKHDVECLGFYIYHPDCGTVCYITDTTYVPTIFTDVNHFLIEANYCIDILQDRVFDQSIDPGQANRTAYNHLSIQECQKILRNQDLSQCENIVLVHLSGSNADSEQFKSKIVKQTGKQVHIAKPGLTLNLSLDPF